MHKNILECFGMQENFENEKVCLVPIPYIFKSLLNNLRLFPKTVCGKLDKSFCFLTENRDTFLNIGK